ncbi:MAG: hypothetical protein JOY61_16980, partial [Chloroflexi bacterium]|nr:hypothetical protein [Chloroflexota bacterium]
MEPQEIELRVADNAASRTIATILRHDAKVTSYKLALIRAINDVVLSFPDAGSHNQPVAIPLRILAEYWVAYYWPFVDPRAPISQGPQPRRNSLVLNDMTFRPALSALRAGWEEITGGAARASDGFVLINDLRVVRRRAGYPAALRRAFSQAVTAVVHSIEQPIRYAGPVEWGVFPRPEAYATLLGQAVAIPGTSPSGRCVVVGRELWSGFLDLSLWVEALSIHEWSLFTESVAQPNGITIERGHVYILLTD